jgi:hypothetical protein
MQIDQRHVTTVNLHDGRSRDFLLQPDGRGYKLSLVSRDDVVHILLSPHDLTKLRQELGKTDFHDARDVREGKEARQEHAPGKEHRPLAEGRKAAKERPDEEPGDGGSYVFQWSTLDWLSFN